MGREDPLDALLVVLAFDHESQIAPGEASAVVEQFKSVEVHRMLDVEASFPDTHVRVFAAHLEAEPVEHVSHVVFER